VIINFNLYYKNIKKIAAMLGEIEVTPKSSGIKKAGKNIHRLFIYY